MRQAFSMATAERWVLDRFEGEQAVLENMRTRETAVWLRAELPADAREGDVLYADQDGLSIDQTETTARAEALRARLDRLKRNKR